MTQRWHDAERFAAPIEAGFEWLAQVRHRDTGEAMLVTRVGAQGVHCLREGADGCRRLTRYWPDELLSDA